MHRIAVEGRTLKRAAVEGLTLNRAAVEGPTLNRAAVEGLTLNRAAVEGLWIGSEAAVGGDVDAPAHPLAGIVADEALPGGEGDVGLQQVEVGGVEGGEGNGSVAHKLHLVHGPDQQTHN